MVQKRYRIFTVDNEWTSDANGIFKNILKKDNTVDGLLVLLFLESM